MNIDQHLVSITQQYGTFSYLVVAFIVFAETGLVVTPFLPGDSLLFAVGALSAKGAFNAWIMYPLLLVAVIAGDNTNYWIGHKIGRKAFRGKHIFNENHLQKTEEFYEKHGPKTIIYARFIPIVRTFAPFVAGVGRMDYRNFLTFSIGGAFLWLSLFLLGGFFFGNIPIVKHNFEIVILAIIGLSIVPAIYAYVLEHMKKRAK
jgi:membrane-associated protein